MAPRYLSLSELLLRVDEPYRSGCQRLLSSQGARFQSARGSTHNHQAWSGGYLDHLREAMNAAVVLHGTLDGLRPLPFSLSDALLVLFVHDLEKPWSYTEVGGHWQRTRSFQSKEDAHAFRLKKLREHGIDLPADLERAVFFVEGEIHHYDPRRRTMSPLAAFCHLCDVTSARIWYDHPSAEDDPWPGAKRSGA